MRYLLRILLVSVPFCQFMTAQIPGDGAELLDGVSEIAQGRFSGALCVYGERAFPVINGRAENGEQEPIMAAARWGAGRVVVFGHTAYLEQDLFRIADTAKLVSNTARWVSGGKRSPKIGVLGIPDLAARLRRLALDARDITLDRRRDVDAIFLLARNLAENDVEPLAKYIQEGGGIVAGAVGWIVQNRDSDRDLTTEFAGNRLIAPAGILWALGEVKPTSAAGFRTTPSPAALSHTARAVEAAEKQGLSAQVSITLMRAAGALPVQEALFGRIEKIAAASGVQAIPSAFEPITKDNTAARLALAAQLNRLRHTPPEEVKAHPAAAEFPGSVPRDAPRVTRDVLVQTSGWRFGWFGTGLYAAPGEVISVRVPAGVEKKGIGIIIGAHTDQLWNLPKWKRAPRISFSTPVRAAETRAANAFGGAIYLSVPPGSRMGDFVATISGAVPAPRYVHGETDLAEWRDSIRKRPAPWAELECDTIVLTVPSAVVRELDDPASLMQLWTRISDQISDFAAIPNWRVRAERMVPDVQLGMEGAALHAGYPIVMFLPKAETLVDIRELMQCRLGGGGEKRGTWGFPHELGHQVQSDLWSFEGAVEPTASLFALYVWDRLCGLPVDATPRGSKEFRAQQMAKYNFAKPDFEQWKNDSSLSLTMYVQMQRAFGWDPFKRVFAQYLLLPAGERPKSDAEKRDQWMVRFSRQVRRNLGPFFQAWGVPTSASARASIADLPVWMPEELPAPVR